MWARVNTRLVLLSQFATTIKPIRRAAMPVRSCCRSEGSLLLDTRWARAPKRFEHQTKDLMPVPCRTRCSKFVCTVSNA